MPFRRLPRWLSSLVVAAILGGGLGLPLADALVFHQLGDRQANVPALASPDQAVGHTATCAIAGAPTSSLHAACATGRLVALEASTTLRLAPATVIPTHQPVAESRPRAPPISPA